MTTTPTETTESTVPTWILTAFDEPVVRASLLPWGFTNESWAADVASGRRYAVTRLASRPDLSSVAARIVAVQLRFEAAGLPVPRYAIAPPPAAPGVLIAPLLAGTTGAPLLDDPAGGELVGRILGSTWQRLAGVDPSGLDLPDGSVSADRGRQAAHGRLVRLAPALPSAGRARIADAIESLSRDPVDRPPGVVHGDLVPVNVIIHDGTLVALLDLEAVHVGDPFIDVAWFDWIVWFHHRAIHGSAWRSFAAAAGIEPDDPSTVRRLRALAVIRLLEIVDGLASTDAHRGRWLEHLGAWLDRP